MKRVTVQLIISSFMLISSFACAQDRDIIGFWKIANVDVGEENMTPVAKWTKINADGTYQSGNGWLQTARGKWTYDRQHNLFSVVDSMDVLDEFGAFTVSFENQNMIFERQEYGMNVIVTLSPIQELPMSPADYLEGVWELVSIKKNSQSEAGDLDNSDGKKLFFRWDRIYENYPVSGERQTGYWHINGHRPELTLLPHR